MTNTVLIKRSSTANAVPAAGNLIAGELAINYADGNLFYKNASNVVTVIASNQFVSVTGNVTGGNVLTGGLISATGNITGGNIITSGSAGNISGSGNIIATGNITGGNLLTGGLVSSTGTITGSSHLGAVVSVTANITGGNVLTGGIVSSTGNILSAGNIIASKVVTANDNIVINSTSAEGGQLVLAWAGINGLVAQGNSTWNLDTDAGNTFRLFYQNGISATSVLLQANSTSNVVSFPSTAGVSATGNVFGGNLLTSGLITATGNVTGGNILTVGQISATGTITTAGSTNSTGFAVGNGAVSNVALGMFPTAGTPGEYAIRDYSNVFTNMYFDVGTGGATSGAFKFRTTNAFTTLANINSSGITTPLAISATGNVTGNYFIGNGSQLTGIIASAGAAITNGTSNVVVAASGNVTVGVAGVPTVATFTTSGLTANIIASTNNGNGTNFKVGDDAWIGDINLSDTMSVRGQQNAANAYIVFGNADSTALGRAGSGPLTYGGAFSATGNVTGGNLLTAGLISATGTITGSSHLGAVVSVTGNVTGNYFIGNGSLLTGIASGNSTSISNGTSNVTVVSSGGNVTVGVGGTANVAVFATTGEYITGLISASGNITGGNILTAGLVSTLGNITTANNFVYANSTSVAKAYQTYNSATSSIDMVFL